MLYIRRRNRKRSPSASSDQTSQRGQDGPAELGGAATGNEIYEMEANTDPLEMEGSSDIDRDIVARNTQRRPTSGAN